MTGSNKDEDFFFFLYKKRKKEKVRAVKKNSTVSYQAEQMVVRTVLDLQMPRCSNVTVMKLQEQLGLSLYRVNMPAARERPHQI